MTAYAKCTSSVVSGYNTAVCSLTAMTSKNGYKFYCVVSNTAGSVTTDTVTLTVKS